MKLYMSATIVSIAAIFSMNSYAERAVVIQEDGTCEVFIPNGETRDGLPPLAYPIYGDVHAVGQDAGVDEFFPGQGKVTCKGTHDVVLEHATAGRGFICGVPHQELGYVTTTNSQIIASPSGQWTMQCHFRRATKEK